MKCDSFAEMVVMAGSKSMISPSLLDHGPGIAGGEVSVQDAADTESRGRDHRRHCQPLENLTINVPERL